MVYLHALHLPLGQEPLLLLPILVLKARVLLLLPGVILLAMAAEALRESLHLACQPLQAPNPWAQQQWRPQPSFPSQQQHRLLLGDGDHRPRRPERLGLQVARNNRYRLL